MTRRNTNVSCTTVSVRLWRSLHCCSERPGSSRATSLQSRPRTSEVLYFATDYTRRPSSTLFHNALRSGTEKAVDSVDRHSSCWSMVHHPSTGQNLLMTGTDLLDTPTGTTVAQRSDTGQGILGAKEGKGMWVWSAMVLSVLSSLQSHMSAGGCSLTGRRDNVSFLTNGEILSVTGSLLFIMNR
jgi:hypothetical protein